VCFFVCGKCIMVCFMPVTLATLQTAYFFDAGAYCFQYKRPHLKLLDLAHFRHQICSTKPYQCCPHLFLFLSNISQHLLALEDVHGRLKPLLNTLVKKTDGENSTHLVLLRPVLIHWLSSTSLLAHRNVHMNHSFLGIAKNNLHAGNVPDHFSMGAYAESDKP